MSGNNTAFSTIITSKLGERPTCVYLLLQLYLQNLLGETCICTSILKLHQLNLHCMKRATGVSALTTICSTGKIVYIQIIRTDLWSFQAHWSSEGITTVMLEIHEAKKGKAKFISILYTLAHSIQLKSVNLSRTYFT